MKEIQLSPIVWSDLPEWFRLRGDALEILIGLNAEHGYTLESLLEILNSPYVVCTERKGRIRPVIYALSGHINKTQAEDYAKQIAKGSIESLHFVYNYGWAGYMELVTQLITVDERCHTIQE